MEDACLSCTNIKENRQSITMLLPKVLDNFTFHARFIDCFYGKQNWSK